jgi:soluble lytic murein transglycosylase-like protein
MFDELIRKYAALNGIPESWIFGVIQTESSGNPDSFNPNDPSYGLMGLTMATARDMGYTGDSNGLFDPETNIRYGSKYLAWIVRRWSTGNPAEVYSAFNSGRPKLYLSSAEVSSNVERFMRFAAEWEPIVVAGGASIGLLFIAGLYLWKKKGK